MYNLKVSVKRIGKSIPTIMQEVAGMWHFETQERIKEIADEAAEDMKKIIKESKVRPDTTGDKLEDSIESISLNTTAGVVYGVGDISKAPKYWALLNYGGKHPMAGKRVPAGFFDIGNPRPDNSEFRKAGNWDLETGTSASRKKGTSFVVSENSIFPETNYIEKAEKEAIYKLIIFTKVLKDEIKRMASQLKV